MDPELLRAATTWTAFRKDEDALCGGRRRQTVAIWDRWTGRMSARIPPALPSGRQVPLYRERLRSRWRSEGRDVDFASPAAALPKRCPPTRPGALSFPAARSLLGIVLDVDDDLVVVTAPTAVEHQRHQAAADQERKESSKA